MLDSLYIRDYALIDELEVNFSSGLNIITGETGAGKSILVGALKLILGERASSDTIREGKRKAIVEGVFRIKRSDLPNDLAYDEQKGDRIRLVLRREVSEGGSRAYVNDSPTTVQRLHELAEELVDLHGQHEHQSLLRTKTHLTLVDSFGGLAENVTLCASAFMEIERLLAEQDSLLQRRDELQRERELHAFQLEEIEQVGPAPGEDQLLDEERILLENAEHLFASTTQLYNALYQDEQAIHDRLAGICEEFGKLTGMDATFQSPLDELEGSRIAIEEAARFLQDYSSRIEFNPERLEEVRERLIALDRLKLRYGGTLEAVEEQRLRSEEKMRFADDFEAMLRRTEEEIEQAKERYGALAWDLHHRRKTVAAQIEASVVRELKGLGIPDATFEVLCNPDPDEDGWILERGTGERYTAYSTGMDRIVFQLSTNAGESPKPLARVASGGEISRIMIALKTVLAGKDRLPVLVFDEIDTGVSGGIARTVGERIRDLAGKHQVIAITHLAQVASLADVHYKVEKVRAEKRTVTRMRRLSEAEREAEIAGLLSGKTISEAAFRSARELMVSSSNAGD